MVEFKPKKRTAESQETTDDDGHESSDRERDRFHVVRPVNPADLSTEVPESTEPDAEEDKYKEKKKKVKKEASLWS